MYFLTFLKLVYVLDKIILHLSFPKRAPVYPRVIIYSVLIYLEKCHWTFNYMIHKHINSEK